MQARLFCKTGEMAGTEFEVNVRATIGSNPENSIRLPAKVAASKHARIYYDDDESCFFLEDLGSETGTQLDGARITEKEKLTGFHVITFVEGSDFMFQPLDDSPRQPQAKVDEGSAKPTERTVIEMEPGPTLPENLAEMESTGFVGEAEIEKTVIEESVPRMPKVPIGQEEHYASAAGSLSENYAADVVLVTEGDGKIFGLHNGENLVGRELGCDILIDDPSISRQHAVISVEENKITLKDLGSRNLTFLAEKRVEGVVEIKPNARIWFGQIKTKLTQKHV